MPSTPAQELPIDTITVSTPESLHDVIYVLRTTQQHHVQLSVIADHKANIIVGAGLVYLSFIATRLGQDQTIALPFLLLALGCGLGALLAVLALTPRVRQLKPTDVNFNPLFFGNFLSLSRDDYLQRMDTTLASDASARRALMLDIYHLGTALRRKYNYLRYAYWLFAAGIVSALLAVAVEAALAIR